MNSTEDKYHLPVLPHKPNFCPASIRRLMPLSKGLISPKFQAIPASKNSTLPLVGHSETSSWVWVAMLLSSRGVSSANSLIRAMAPSDVSSNVQFWISSDRISPRSIIRTRAIPSRPGSKWERRATDAPTRINVMPATIRFSTRLSQRWIHRRR
jgi:hypothetical protein